MADTDAYATAVELKGGLDQMESRLYTVRGDILGRIERLDVRLGALETRMGAVEGRLVAVEHKVDSVLELLRNGKH